MKFIDDKNKKLSKWNRNYFFVGTILFIVLNIVLFAVYGLSLHTKLSNSIPNNDHYSFFDQLYRLILQFCGNFTHSTWEHVLQNMLGFSFCLFYIERKYGTLKFLGILFTLTLFVSFMSIYDSSTALGSSYVWFACFGFVLIDFLFSFRRKYRNTTNIIVGVIVILLEFIRCGFYDDYTRGARVIKWGFYPAQLTGGHAAGFLVGICVCVLIHLTILYSNKKEFVNN